MPGGNVHPDLRAGPVLNGEGAPRHKSVWASLAVWGPAILILLMLSPEMTAATERKPSLFFEGIQFAPTNSIIRWAQGSDNWPMTWGDDGWVYTAYGDGNGFAPFVEQKLSLGFARLRGTPTQLQTENLRAPSLERLGPGAAGLKASGLLMVEGTLYLWARNAGLSRLVWSEDHGRTWNWADWRFEEAFACPTFLNFGPNYAGARDDFVYVYSPDTNSAYARADRMILGRAGIKRIKQRESWEFFAGLSTSNTPLWTSDLNRRGAVFSNPGKCYRSSVNYHSASGRYLWVQTGEGADTRSAGGFAIYDAPEPWGPWTTVFETNSWDVGPGETASFPACWMDPMDNRLHLAFSGDHALSIRPAIFVPRKSGTPVRFEKQVLTTRYLCDGITSGDLNRDGNLDIIAGPFWYRGPDFGEASEIYPARDFDRAASPTDSMFSFVHDFNHDGWPDVLQLGRVHLHQAFWYENPRGESGFWKPHFVFHRVQGESPPFADVDGDGQPELVAHWQGAWGMLKPDPASPVRPWRFHPITEFTSWAPFYHGEGLGDLNGDGRLDLILNDGWYEQTHDGREWKRHSFRFAAKGGAQMFACDVDGNGVQDVITALDAHGWGLAWFENQSRDEPNFVPHHIMGSRDEESTFGVAFSQPHALALGDFNRDGLLDIVTGKRRWAHGPTGDIEPMGQPVLYWFELVREGGTARYIPHLIDTDSGVGVQITVSDINRDGKPDILTASKLGAFLFLNR